MKDTTENSGQPTAVIGLFRSGKLFMPLQIATITIAF